MNCKGVTQGGTPCKRKAKVGSEFCTQHGAPKSEKKEEKVKFNYDLIFEDLREEFLLINETTNMIVLMNNIMKVIKYIENINSRYNFDEIVDLKIHNKIFWKLYPLIFQKKRTELILDFLLYREGRNLTQPFSSYTVNPLTEEEKKQFYTFIPRGYVLGKVPIRPNTTKTEPKKEIPKTEPKKEIPKTEPNKSSKEDLLKMMEELKKYLIDKNIKVYLKLIMTSTQALKYTRKEIMDLYKEFHPDKAGTNIKAQKLCTLVSTKISLLKKKLDSTSSPTRPIGNLYNEMSKIVYS